MLMFVPPPMLFAPATLASLVQFMTLVFGLWAMASVSFNGLVQFVLGVNNAALAAVAIFCVQPRQRAEQDSSGQYRAR
jgi:hypothetical protein